MSETYGRDFVFFAYAKWHYGQGIRELIAVAQNFLWFIAHFFSFKLLLKTLFAPWRRLGESYGRGFNVGAYASAFVVNSLMRLVGFVTRTCVLVVGLASYVLVLALSILIFIIWFLAPAILIGSVILSATFFAI